MFSLRKKTEMPSAADALPGRLVRGAKRGDA